MIDRLCIILILTEIYASSGIDPLGEIKIKQYRITQIYSFQDVLCIPVFPHPTQWPLRPTFVLLGRSHSIATIPFCVSAGRSARPSNFPTKSMKLMVTSLPLNSECLCFFCAVSCTHPPYHTLTVLMPILTLCVHIQVASIFNICLLLKPNRFFEVESRH